MDALPFFFSSMQFLSLFLICHVISISSETHIGAYLKGFEEFLLIIQFTMFVQTKTYRT